SWFCCQEPFYQSFLPMSSTRISSQTIGENACPREPILKLPVFAVEPGEVVKTGDGIGMSIAQDLLANAQGALVELFRSLVLVHGFVKHVQIVQAIYNIVICGVEYITTD